MRGWGSLGVVSVCVCVPLTISVGDLGELDGGIQQHLAAALGPALVPAREEEEGEEGVSWARRG